MDAVAERRDELVALACELIGYDTTSRSDPGAPARQEAALQEALADRLRACGAESDLARWPQASQASSAGAATAASSAIAGALLAALTSPGRSRLRPARPRGSARS